MRDVPRGKNGKAMSAKKSPILPCPFCHRKGCQAVEDTFTPEYRVWCGYYRCGAIGPRRQTEAGAIAIWNATARRKGDGVQAQ